MAGRPHHLAAATTVLLLPAILAAATGGGNTAKECARATPAVRRTITVSGQSAGASIAIQHLVAFSESVAGAAIAAGSPYGCGVQPLHGWTCYYGGLDVDASVRYLRRRFEQRMIDDPVNLKTSRVFLFSGKLDFVVLPNVMRALERQLLHFIPKENIASSYGTWASHVWSVDHGDKCPCGTCAWQQASSVLTSSDLCCNINNCAFDLSGAMLRHLYGPDAAIKPRVPVRHSLRWIDTWPYWPAEAGPTNQSTMLRWAPAYVPAACVGLAQVDKCRVHVNYHGCTSKPLNSTDAGWYERLIWVQSIDLNQYAEANDIIVIYPQAAGSVDIGEGCFNWASYEDDPLFDTRLGVQLNTVVNLLDDLPNALNSSYLFDGAGPRDLQ